jgi:hypothetical protein
MPVADPEVPVSAPVRQLLDLFDSLPDPDKRAAAAEILHRLPGASADRWLDTDYHAECEADAGPDVPLAEIRAALAVLPGDLTADFAAERDER